MTGVVLALIGGGVALSHRSPPGVGPLRTGPATSSGLPGLRGEAVTIGSANVANYGDKDIRIDSVVPRGAVNIKVVGILIMDAGPNAPLSANTFPPAGAVPLHSYRVRPFDPTLIQKNIAAIMVGLSVEPGVRGFIEGLDVRYRAGRTKYHTFLPHEMTVCGYERAKAPCSEMAGP